MSMRRNGEASAGSSSRDPSFNRSALPASSHREAGAHGGVSAEEGMPPEAEISALLKVSNGLVQWSPCGKFLAAAHSNRLTIREKSTLQILQQYSAMDVIQSIAWSDDSHLVSTSMYKRAVIQIWSVKDSSWTCKINEGLAGMVFGKWTSDSRHFITVSDFQLHATVWSLTDSAKYVIRNPKLAAEGFSFSPDSELLAVAERHDCKDFIGIYNCESWELVTHFPLESYDCVEISWSPDNTTIAVRDSHLEFRILLYAVNGTLLSKYQAYEHALGLKAIEWSTSGQFLALGSYDDHLRVLSHLNWKPIADFDHETIAVTMTRVNKTAVEYEEYFAGGPITERPQGKRIPISQQSSSSLLSNSSLAASVAAKAAGGKKAREICFVVRDPPFSVLTTTPDPLKENPKMGISRVTWSSDSAFVATKSDQMPHNVWIWQTETMTLHAVVSLIQPVRNVRWDPVHCRLAMCSGENRIYLWSPGGVSWVDIPVESWRQVKLWGDLNRRAKQTLDSFAATMLQGAHSSISNLLNIPTTTTATTTRKQPQPVQDSISMQKAVLALVTLCLVLAVLQFAQVDAHQGRQQGHHGKAKHHHLHKHRSKSRGKSHGRRLTSSESYSYGDDDDCDDDDFGHHHNRDHHHKKMKKHGFGNKDYGHDDDDCDYGKSYSNYDYGKGYDDYGYGKDYGYGSGYGYDYGKGYWYPSQSYYSYDSYGFPPNYYSYSPYQSFPYSYNYHIPESMMTGASTLNPASAFVSPREQATAMTNGAASNGLNGALGGVAPTPTPAATATTEAAVATTAAPAKKVIGPAPGPAAK